MSVLPLTDWAPLTPPPRSPTAKGAAIRVSAGPSCKRYRPRLLVSIDVARIEAPPRWLIAGATCTVALGRTALAGTLRIVRGSEFRLRRAPRGSHLQLFLPSFPGLPEAGAPATACEHDWSDDWLDITLPAWLTAALPAAPAAPAPTAPTPAAPAAGTKRAEPYTLAPDVVSHPQWASPKGRAAHEAAIKGGAA